MKPNNLTMRGKLRWALAVMAVLLSISDASAAWLFQETHYYRVAVTGTPTGAGTVYASSTSQTLTKSGNYYQWYGTEYFWNSTLSVTMTAEPSDGYRFEKWVEVSNGTETTIDADNPSPSIIRSISATTGGYSNNPPTFKAYFKSEGSVVARVADSDKTVGAVAISGDDSTPGAMVTIRASNINMSEHQGWYFDYWEKEGESEPYSTESVIEVEVPTSKQVYIAHFAKVDTEDYCFIRNKKSGRYLRLSDTKSVGTPSGSNNVYSASFNGSFTLVSEESAISDPACVFILSGHGSGSSALDKASIVAQEISVGGLTGSRVVSNPLKVRAYNSGTYTISTEISSSGLTSDGYFKDNNGTPILQTGADDNAEWEILQLTEATLSTNFFGAAPNPALTRDGKYYCTLYTAFPYKLTSGKAYYVEADKIVTADNGTTRVFCTEIADGIVPPKCPVILECEGTSAADNKLVPLKFDVAGSAPESNIIQGQIKVLGDNAVGDGQVFVLSTGSRGLAIYKLATGTAVPDNRGYVVLDEQAQAAAQSMFFSFDAPETDAIEMVLQGADDAHTVIFDLQGRRVYEPSTSGVYIVNGKKTVIKK